LRIGTESPASLPAHEAIPIRFLASSRLCVEALRRGEFIELPIAPFWKDYDVNPADRMTSFASQHDASNWALIAAFDGARRIGGMLLARDTPTVDMLEGRRDLAVMLDVRVHPDARGLGVGKALFAEASRWANENGCTELKVETQDINVGACRFYAAMGFHLAEVNPHAYPPELNETQLIWRRAV